VHETQLYSHVNKFVARGQSRQLSLNVTQPALNSDNKFVPKS